MAITTRIHQNKLVIIQTHYYKNDYKHKISMKADTENYKKCKKENKKAVLNPEFFMNHYLYTIHNIVKKYSNKKYNE